MRLSFNAHIEPANIEGETLKDVSIITAGEAKGHGVYINTKFLSDVTNQGNASNYGVKSRFGHPDFFGDALGTELGRVTNFRLKGDTQVIADVEFITTEKNKAEINHIQTFAEKYPQSLGLSIEFSVDSFEDDDKERKTYVNLGQLHAVDFVHEPAANPSGLFSSKKLSDEQKKEFRELFKEIAKDELELLRFEINLLKSKLY